MINRTNYRRVEEHLQYKDEILLLKPATIKRTRSSLNHLLRWADETAISEAHVIRPTFPAYLRDETKLSADSVKRTLETARAFLRWCAQEYPKRFESQKFKHFINSLRIRLKPGRPQDRNPYTDDEVLEIVSLRTNKVTLTDFRDQAGIALSFVSGMRIGALVSMTIQAINLKADPPEIRQWHDLGVRTKFGKSATTFLIPLPSLLSVIREWDSYVRSRLPETALWFAPLTRDGTALRGDEEANKNYDQRMRAGLKRLCKRADIPYRRPHDLRHGHARYVRTHSRHPSTREAIRYNLMHGNEDVTDIYLEATYETARRVYAQLAPSTDSSSEKTELVQNIQRQLDQLKEQL
jgi:integrase